jgi:hypothetical protein
VLRRREQGHETGIVKGRPGLVQGSAESAANMPCVMKFPHDIASSKWREPCAGSSAGLLPLTFP